MITLEQIDRCPAEIGVYLFKNKDKILYIGKSVNIKARVKSHFENAKLDGKERLIIKNSDNIEFIVIESEFEALILESELIKKYRPKYNVIWKDGKSYLYIKVTVKDKYPKVLLSRRPDFAKTSQDKKNLYFGPFSSTRVVESLINDIRHIVPFCTEKKIGEIPCFYSKINLCYPCPNSIHNLNNEVAKKKQTALYRKNIRRIIGFINGKVTEILSGFYRELKTLIKEKKYEEAIIIRNKIFRLERLINHPTNDNGVMYLQSSKKENVLPVFLEELRRYFPGLEKLERIECYDISNLKEINQTGSMVVLTKGKVDKKEYRRFRLKSQKSDFDRLTEVIKRRFKNDWLKPDLIIIDGGRPQVKTIVKVIKEINFDIPVLGIAKNPDRLVIGVEGFPTVRFPQTNPGFNMVRLIRDESHRFAKKYHLFLRNRDFLI